MSEEMNSIIQQKLDEIEQREDIRIIHCIESGSRAWGFASPDSDYDVRFIYVRRPEFYLKLEKTRDVIEWQLDDTLDINGWDIRKALQLLYRSNSTLFEWNGSPIVYRTTEDWKRVSDVINEYFVMESGIYHYLSTAKGNYREYLRTDEVRLKKYFYVLRPILACRWIMDRKSPPPMLFSELMDAELDSELRPYVEKLLDIKMNSPEKAYGERIDPLNEYIERSIDDIQSGLEAAKDSRESDWDKLNEIFLSIIKNYRR
ncbi:MAG: nucleotidyltransferase domain-containing protein [Oscillospiraceae bacterium]